MRLFLCPKLPLASLINVVKNHHSFSIARIPVLQLSSPKNIKQMWPSCDDLSYLLQEIGDALALRAPEST